MHSCRFMTQAQPLSAEHLSVQLAALRFNTNTWRTMRTQVLVHT